MKFSAARLLIILNLAIFSLSLLFNYKLPENITFWNILFASLLLLAIAFFLWKLSGEFNIPLSTIVLLQIGLILHYIGTTKFYGVRGYNLVLIEGIRYDKLVHFLGSAFLVFILRDWNEKYNFISGKGKKLWILLIVVGIGAMIEMIEYGTYRPPIGSILIQNPYDNNLQDMIAGLLGSIFATLTK